MQSIFTERDGCRCRAQGRSYNEDSFSDQRNSIVRVSLGAILQRIFKYETNPERHSQKKAAIIDRRLRSLLEPQ